MSVAELIGPKGRPFTAEQARAVLDRDGDLLLSAAAGSGKTSVLVERFVRHVLDDEIAPSRILAITFTEKAAGELKQRIRERLLELGERDLAREAEGAWVSTVHGFCARLLRGHAVAAGLDPAFTVLDETAARGLRQEAWDRAFAEWLSSRGDAALDLAAAFTTDRLRLAIEDVYDALRSAGATAPRLPLPPLTDPPSSDRLLALRDTAAASLDPGDSRKTVLRALDALERCAQVFATLEPGAVPESGLLDQALFKAGNTAVLKCDACAAYLEEHARFAAACASYRGARAAIELDALLDGYASAYGACKRARSALDFDDLELLARDLLLEVPAVRAAAHERFERVMVDEFQDSNPRQVELFDLVGRGNVFLVGDELQSIYGFRHADVDVFRARRAALSAEDRAAALTMNFRSRAPVLEAVNAAFADRFGEGFAPLVPGRPDAGDGPPEVEVLVTAMEGWDDVDLGALPRAQSWRQAEARLLAQRVCDLVRDEGVAAEDVVVLMRSAGDLPVYERALEEAGLQTLAAGGRGYWARQVVRDLCAWLAALANPRDEEQLYGVLASPLVGASTDALALIAEAGSGNAWRLLDAAFAEPAEPPPAAPRDDDAPPADWLLALAPSPEDEAADPPPDTPETGLDRAPETGPDRDPQTGSDGDPEVGDDEAPEARSKVAALAAALPAKLSATDRERLAAFRARFVNERALLPRLALDEILRRAVEATDYDLHVLRLPGGARRLANVHKLLRLAAEHERVHGRDVRGLVDRATEELEADAREADAPVELGDARAVRLMTIHAAKGLEFPVVVVADLGRKPQNDAPALMVNGDRLGVRLPGVAGGREHALDYDELREERRAAEAAEEDRVLYVALTRAEERLILSGVVNVEKWPDLARNGVAPIAWLAPALSGGVDAVPDRCTVSTPETIGTVLRRESLAPAGADLPLAPPPPARAPEPPPAAPPPAARSLSYSALAQWKRCGYRFYLQRILGLPEEEERGGRASTIRTPSGALDPRTRGSLAHEALEHGGDPPGAIDAAAARWGLELTEEERADLVGLVAGFAGTPLAERIAAATDVKREHTFAFPLGTALLNGIVDVLATEPDGTALVVDYKTDRVALGEDGAGAAGAASGDADAPATTTGAPDGAGAVGAAGPAELVADHLAALVERDYGVQLRTYALAALHAGHERVEVAYAFLEQAATPVTFRFTEADTERLHAELEQLAEGALSGDFPVAAEPHIGLCAGCPGRRALCNHDETLTGRELPLAPGGDPS